MGKLSRVLVAAMCGWMAAGCSTVNNPAPGSLAQVRIEGHSAAQVDDALRAVFTEKGYKVHFDTFVPGSDSCQIELGRKGGAMSRATYGSWLHPDVEERVKLSVARSSGGWLVTLEAAMISDVNEAFEQKHPLTGLTRHAFQRLLDEAKTRLEQRKVEAK
jgi:hypothetical protein